MTLRKKVTTYMNSKVFRFGCLAVLFSSTLFLANQAGAQQRSFSSSSGNRSSGSFNSGRSSSGSSGTSGTRQYNNNTMVGDASITVDQETRRVIVVTDEDTAQNISMVISNLDRPKPQVLIKVVFAELTYNNGLDVGIDGSYTRTDSGITNSLSSAVASTALNNLGTAGTSGNPVGAGLYQVTGQNFSATLRLIASAGKTEVLSRPSIMVQNNQPATITVGDSVPFITGTTYSPNIGQVNTVTYKDIGIILKVTPFITADGLVQMIVAPEISALTDEYVTISSNVNMRVYSTRSANTVVVTPNGQPIVIGGLMSNEKIMSESKVPWLGDIPWVGAAFRRRVTSNAKKELLIFMLPIVVRAPTELAANTDKEAKELDLSRSSFNYEEVQRFFDGIPVVKPEPDKKKKK